MRQEFLLSIIALLLFTMPGAYANSGQEETVALDDVPKAVKATIIKEADGADVLEVEREIRKGQTVYEAEFVRNGKEIEIEVSLDGTLLKTEIDDEDDDSAKETEITFEDIPKRAQAALKHLANGAVILEAEQEKDDGVLTYEAQWKVNGTTHEATVLADGTLVELEELISVNDVPESVLTKISKHFGKYSKIVVEKKMVVTYEIEAEVNGKHKELIVLATGIVLDDDYHD